jgi:hypothetical protein
MSGLELFLFLAWVVQFSAFVIQRLIYRAALREANRRLDYREKEDKELQKIWHLLSIALSRRADRLNGPTEYFAGMDRGDSEKHLSYLLNTKWDNLIPLLDLIWHLRSADTIIRDMEVSVAYGAVSCGKMNFCVSSRNVVEVQAHMQAAAKILRKLLCMVDPEASIRQASLLTELCVKRGHLNQAKYLADQLGLGTSRLDVNVVKEFINHCILAQVDSETLINPELVPHYRIVRQAIALLDQQALAPAAPAEEANPA